MMRFVFTKLFYALLAFGLIPLSLSWNQPLLRWLTLAYDLALISAAIFDAWNGRLPAPVLIERHVGDWFGVRRVSMRPSPSRSIPTCGARAKLNCERWAPARSSRRGANRSGAAKDASLNRCAITCVATRCGTFPGRPPRDAAGWSHGNIRWNATRRF